MNKGIFCTVVLSAVLMGLYRMREQRLCSQRRKVVEEEIRNLLAAQVRGET